MLQSIGIRTQSAHAGRAVVPLLLLCSAVGMFDAPVFSYNFVYFGGRLNREGVDTGQVGNHDFFYSWNKPDNGTITWFLDRNELTNAACDAACFAALKARVQPELDKWALWIRINFAEAANLNDADVRIRFIVNAFMAGGADAGPDGNTGTTLDHAIVRINPNGLYGWNTVNGRDDFSFTILHEFGHVLGLGDLYDYPGTPLDRLGEDFCDHGLPSKGPPPGAPNAPGSAGLPDTRTKEDNVMETRGWVVLDNDTIHGAEWLWGCKGSNGIVTGELSTRTGGLPTTFADLNNKAVPHHGLTQTLKTWTYRGSQASFLDPPPKVTLFFSGIQAARSVGPGTWNAIIFPDRVEFDANAAYEGNFKFELDCDQGPERYGDARVAAASTTEFTATPAGGGRQTFPFDKVFGADCAESVSIPAVSEWGMAILTLLLFTGIALKFGRRRILETRN